MKKRHVLLLPLTLALSFSLGACVPFLPFEFPGLSSSSSSAYLPPDLGTVDPHLPGGFKIQTKGRDPELHVANKVQEAVDQIVMAIIQHYEEVRIRFAFYNDLSCEDFCIYYVPLGAHVGVGSSSYAKGNERVNVFQMSYYEGMTGLIDAPVQKPAHVASRKSRVTKKNTYDDLLNANQLIRLASQKKRDRNFDDFPIEHDNKGELFVSNSEELWWAVSAGYKPQFPVGSSKVKAIYEAACDVLRTYVNDEMTPYEKMRAIYEWIVSMNRYDYDAVEENKETTLWIENNAYFLEGIFQDHLGVCDAFSKTFALLGGIERLPVRRTYGYTAPDKEGKIEGHAWNYGVPFHDEGDDKAYLICPTWGGRDLKIEKKGRNIGLCDYGAFCTARSYFQKKSSQPVNGHPGKSIEFIERRYSDIQRSHAPCSPSVWARDRLPGTKQDDFEINSQAEMNRVVKAALAVVGKNSFSVQFSIGNSSFGEETFNSMFQTALSRVPGTGIEMFYVVYDELYDQRTALFIVL